MTIYTDLNPENPNIQYSNAPLRVKESFWTTRRVEIAKNVGKVFIVSGLAALIIFCPWSVFGAIGAALVGLLVLKIALSAGAITAILATGTAILPPLLLAAYYAREFFAGQQPKSGEVVGKHSNVHSTAQNPNDQKRDNQDLDSPGTLDISQEELNEDKQSETGNESPYVIPEFQVIEDQIKKGLELEKKLSELEALEQQNNFHAQRESTSVPLLRNQTRILNNTNNTANVRPDHSLLDNFSTIRRQRQEDLTLRSNDKPTESDNIQNLKNRKNELENRIKEDITSEEYLRLFKEREEIKNKIDRLPKCKESIFIQDLRNTYEKPITGLNIISSARNEKTGNSTTNGQSRSPISDPIPNPQEKPQVQNNDIVTPVSSNTQFSNIQTDRPKVHIKKRFVKFQDEETDDRPVVTSRIKGKVFNMLNNSKK